MLSAAELVGELNWHENLAFLSQCESECRDFLHEIHSDRARGEKEDWKPARDSAPRRLPRVDEHYKQLLMTVADYYGLHVKDENAGQDLSRGKVSTSGGLLLGFRAGISVESAGKILERREKSLLLGKALALFGVVPTNKKAVADGAVNGGDGVGEDENVLAAAMAASSPYPSGDERRPPNFRQQASSAALAMEQNDDSDSDDLFVGAPIAKRARYQTHCEPKSGAAASSSAGAAAPPPAPRGRGAASSVAPAAKPVLCKYDFAFFGKRQVKSFRDNWVKAEWPAIKLEAEGFSDPMLRVPPNGLVSFAITPNEFKIGEGVEIKLQGAGEDGGAFPVVRLLRSSAYAWKIKLKNAAAVKTREEEVEEEAQETPLFFLKTSSPLNEKGPQLFWVAVIARDRVILGAYSPKKKVLEDRILDMVVDVEENGEAAAVGRVTRTTDSDSGVAGLRFRFAEPAKQAEKTRFGFGRAQPIVGSITQHPRRLSGLVWGSSWSGAKERVEKWTAKIGVSGYMERNPFLVKGEVGLVDGGGGRREGGAGENGEQGEQEITADEQLARLIKAG